MSSSLVRSEPPAEGCECGRSTCPTAESPATRTSSTSSTGSPGCATAAAEVAVAGDVPLAYLGDYNIAPTDADVWDISEFSESTHVTPEERATLTALAQVGLVEVVPRPLKYDIAYTFWDYRQLAFPKNRGMRIDLAYATKPFATRVTDAWVDRDARKGKGTSDHAPVVIELGP